VTDTEWAAEIDDLAENKQWDEMWRLTQTAPGIWAQRIIMRLAKSNWQPDNSEEALVWPRMSELAERCEDAGMPPIGLASQVQYINTLKGTDAVSSPDGKVIVTYGRQKRPRKYLYRLPMGELIKRIKGWGPEFSPDGEVLMTWDDNNGAVYLWHLSNGELIRKISVSSTESSAQVARFSPDGKFLATVDLEDRDEGTHLWHLPEGDHIRKIKGLAPDFSPDGKVLITWHHNEAHLYRLPDGDLIRKIAGEVAGAFPYPTQFSSDGRNLITVDSEDFDQYINLYHLPGGELTRKVIGSFPQFSPDGKTLMTEDFYLYHLPDGELIKEIRGSRPEFTRFSPDGKVLVVVFEENREPYMYLYRLSNGELIMKLKVWTAGSTQFSPDGKMLAIVCGRSLDYQTHLYHLPDGQLVNKFDGSSNGFSPDGKMLATTYWDGGADHYFTKLWYLPDGKLIRKIKGYSYHFSPDGNVLACRDGADEDGHYRLWHLPQWKLIKDVGTREPQFAPQRSLLTVEQHNNETKLWRLPPKSIEVPINLAIHRISPAEVDSMTTALEGDSLVDSDRHWLAFILALVRHPRRFDIELDEAPSTIDANEYDIEINE
jgi:WD40 repeat protein